MCYVPIEWNIHAEEFLINVVKHEAIEQLRKYKRFKGTTICLEDVTAKLTYVGYHLWMRKSCDQASYPDKNEYFGISLNRILCEGL